MNEKISSNSLFQLTRAAMLCALVTVTTLSVRIPIPATGGYIHPGDGLVLLCGLFLNPVYAFLAAGIGSAFADLLSGYFIYALPTFVIKGLCALTMRQLYHLAEDKITFSSRTLILASGVLAELWMIGGYFLVECALYHPAAAMTAMPSNGIQALSGVLIAAFLYPVIHNALKR